MQKSLGSLVDDYIAKRGIRLNLDRQSRLKKEEEEEAKARVIAAFKDQEIEISSGKLGIVKYHTKDKPRIKDRAAFNAWIVANDAFDLYTNQVHQEAWEVRREAGEVVPGIEIYPFESLSVGGTRE